MTHHASPAPGDPRSSSSSKSSAMRAVRGGHSIRTRTYVSCAAQSIESMTLMWATTLDRISESRACAQPYGTVLCGPLAYAKFRILTAPQPAPYRIARLTGKPKANLTLADVSAAPAPCPCPQGPGLPATTGKRRAAESPHLITGVITKWRFGWPVCGSGTTVRRTRAHGTPAMGGFRRDVSAFERDGRCDGGRIQRRPDALARWAGRALTRTAAQSARARRTTLPARRRPRPAAGTGRWRPLPRLSRNEGPDSSDFAGLHLHHFLRFFLMLRKSSS
ncbi:hypothetical protein P3T21_007198 [Paraburkholderia sp. GAS334]